MTFVNPQTEEVLLRALEDEACLTPSMHQQLLEVFSPVFFFISKWFEGRYIKQWRELASMRTMVEADAAATMSKDQLPKIFKCYLEDLKAESRPDQRGQSWKYFKGCTESKMRAQAGSTFLANAIWAMGLPRLPTFCYRATRRQATIQTRLGSRPRSHSQCIELVRPSCHRADNTPTDK